MQPRNSQEALANYQTIQSSRKKPQDILRESEERLGIPTATQRQVGLRGAITNTENLIRGVDPSVSGRTQGSLVTDAQKQRLIAMEREPLSDQFREQSRALEGETASIAELQRRASQESQLAIAADDAAENAARGLYQTLYQREQDDIARQERERAFQAEQAAARRASSQGDYLRKYLEQQAITQPQAPQAPQPPLESFFQPEQQQASGGIGLPKPGWALAGLAAPWALPYTAAAGLVSANKDKVGKAASTAKNVITNPTGYIKGGFSKLKGLF